MSQHHPTVTAEQIKRMRRDLEDKPRDLLLFDLATQTGLGMKVLLGLKVADLAPLVTGDPIPVPNVPNGRKPPPGGCVTPTVLATFRRFLKACGTAQADYLFKSRKGSQPLSLSSVSHMVGEWFRRADIAGPGGARGLYRIWQNHYRAKMAALQTGPSHDALGTLQPVEKMTLQETVYQELLQAIVAGKIPPGERLTTQDIARRMNVSPMPVREALSRLGAAGFVQLKKKQSSVVKRLSKANLMEILELRLTLESKAMEKACVYRSQRSLSRLEEIHGHYIAATEEEDVDQILRLNRSFHHTMYAEARMPVLMRIIEGLWDQSSPYLHILMRRSYAAFKRINALSHDRMLAGLEKKDVAETLKWLKTDLKEAANLIMVEFKHASL